MAMFEFLKAKKGRELPLPPPPSPPMRFRGDFETIRPPQAPVLDSPDMLSLPDFPPALPAPAEEKEVTVFDKTIPQEAVESPPKEPEVTVRVLPHPTFIAVEDYKRIVNATNSIRAHLMNAEDFAKKLTELKADEERSLERWRLQLEDVEKKLGYVDQLIETAEKV